MSERVPNGWMKMRLSDFSTSRRGTTYVSSELSGDKEQYPLYINMKSFKVGGGYRGNGDKYFSSPYLPKQVVRKNDLLIANTDVTDSCDILGAPIYLPREKLNDDVLFSHHVTALNIADNIDLNFLSFLLCSENSRLEMKRCGRGTTVKMLDMKDIGKILFLLPPFPEQKKIALILNSVDEVIETNQKKIKKLQDLKKAIINGLLTKGIDHKEFKDSELGRIPKSWKVYELGKLCNFTQGVQISLDETLRVKKDGYIRYLYINDFLLDKNLRFIKDEFPKKIVTEQDLVMANTGHSAGTIFRGKHGVLSNNAFKISIKRLIKSEYLFYYLSTDNYWFKIRKLFNSAGQPHVGHSNIAKLQFLCPPLDEQDKILSICHKIDENILNNEKKLSKIKFLKKSLMQDLLTGKVRVKVN